MGLSAHSIKPDADLIVLQGKELELMKNQVPGWRVVVSPTSKLQSLAQDWKAKDAASAAEIARRLGDVAASAGEGFKAAGITVQGENVSVELCNASLGEFDILD